MRPDGRLDDLTAALLAVLREVKETLLGDGKSVSALPPTLSGIRIGGILVICPDCGAWRRLDGHL
ncbi:hypothetical protein KV205_26145 [Streptomyces sp. SKN60]|uniref:hypothetical protein n=1 Tax=Streptomyces sp. SKN60 TaxID=2855506 RepID=UPI0022456F09|nr:hypothetical protein [Streptomyces sp. SKN60]MCX2183986.1 hypothetical protein [Streptomyces sp. SKN60]